MIIYIASAIIIFAAVKSIIFAWACCAAAKKADQQMEKIMEEENVGNADCAKIWKTIDIGDNTLTIYKHDHKSLSESKNVLMLRYAGVTVYVGFSESGKSGPYRLIFNADENDEKWTMSKEYAEILFGEIQNIENHEVDSKEET